MNNKYFSLTNKTILVTGASAGIGAHAAELFAEHGAHVIAVARTKEKLSAVAKAADKLSGTISIEPFDLCEFDKIDSFVNHIINKYNHVDVLMNNAGLLLNKPYGEYTEQDFDDIFNLNIKALFLLTQAMVRKMKLTGHGNIINIGSAADLFCFEKASIPYTLSKAAVTKLTQQLAIKLCKDNIRVNALCPGLFNTGVFDQMPNRQEHIKKVEAIIPLHKVGDLNELNGALLLLASDASSYMTGSILRVDGGMSINKQL